jgi:hypothetical protein
MMNDGWEKTERGWRKVYSPAPSPVAASDFPCPRVITDTMPETAHVDGKHYTSKSAYRAVTKAHGYVEVGNDPARLRKPEKPKSDPKKRREAVQKAIAQTLG